MEPQVALADQSATHLSKPSWTAPSKAMEALADDLAKPPEHRYGLRCTHALRAEALSILQSCETALVQASSETVGKWLTALGTMCAVPNGSSESARAKIFSYISVLDYPPICFTNGTLKRAAKRFKFFPAVNELSIFFDEVIAPIRKAKFDAARISQAPMSEQTARIGKKTDDPIFLAAIEKWNSLKVEMAEKEREAIRNAPRGELKPIHVPNPELDAYVERAKNV